MLSVFRRLWKVLRGKSHAILNKLEKPEEQLAVFIEELNDSVMSLQKSVAGAVADEKKLKLQLEKMVESVNNWEQKAMLALKGGDESLAREALVRKEEAESQATDLHSSWKSQKEAAERLKSNLGQAKTRVEEAKRQYTLLLARYRAAQTQQKLTETLAPVTDESPMKFIENLNDRILKIEAETEANMELIGDGGNSDFEQKFAHLEKAHRGEQALLALKAKLESPKQIESITLEPDREASPIEVASK